MKILVVIFVFFYSAFLNASNNFFIVTWPLDLIESKVSNATFSVTSDFAEEFFNFICKGKKNKLLHHPMLRKNMIKSMASGKIDIIVPGTILRGVRYSVMYNYVPWGMVVPSAELTNSFCKYIAICRKGEINTPAELSNTTWCVAGRYADIDFFVTREKLKKIFKTNKLNKIIKLYHIFNNEIGLLIPGRRHSVIQSVLIHEADWAIVPEYDFTSYINLFPVVSNKFKIIEWLNPNVKLPGYFVLCKDNSFEQLQEYRDAALNLHKTPAGNQFIISSGFDRFCPVPSSDFCLLTNLFDLLPENDDYRL